MDYVHLGCYNWHAFCSTGYILKLSPTKASIKISKLKASRNNETDLGYRKVGLVS